MLPEWSQHVWVHSSKGLKLDARATQARWVGYDANSMHAHHVYWPDTKRVSVECNVKFVSPTITVHSPPPSYTTATAPATARGTAAPQPPQAPPAPAPAPPTLPPAQLPPPVPGRPGSAPPLTTPSLLPPAVLPLPAQPPSEGASQEEQEVTRLIKPTQPTRKSTRVTKPSQYLRRLEAGEGTTGEEMADYVFSADFDNLIAKAIMDAEADPRTLAEAQSRSDWLRWKEAMDRKMSTLKKAGTWSTVPRPSNKNIIGSKWVFRVKRKADRSVDKYKARLVARGFTQVYGVDYLLLSPLSLNWPVSASFLPSLRASIGTSRVSTSMVRTSTANWTRMKKLICIRHPFTTVTGVP